MQIGSQKWQKVLIEGAADLQIELAPEICSKLTIYAQQLQIWSEKINLTAIRDPYQIAVKHFLDSMAPVGLLPPATSLLDIGAGAGFPGLPLKILRPDLTVILIDAVRKKVSFMQHIIRILDLENIAAIHLRAEDLVAETGCGSGSDAGVGVKTDQHRSRPVALPRFFDTVIARALTSLTSFIGMALPVLADNGKMIALKGRQDRGEIAAAQAFLGSVESAAPHGKGPWQINIDSYRLPLIGDRRSVVTIWRR